jgi:hypothetical protein
MGRPFRSLAFAAVWRRTRLLVSVESTAVPSPRLPQPAKPADPLIKKIKKIKERKIAGRNGLQITLGW